MGAYGVLVIGESGRGKSYSMKNLPPENTVIINCESKPFTFKGGRRFGNTLNTYNFNAIKNAFEAAAGDESIKYVVVDDLQYYILNNFSDRAFEKGFEKYNEIGISTHQILGFHKFLRDDQFVIFLNHEETNEIGEVDVKVPAGKFVKEKVVPKGMFTVLLRSVIKDGGYFFTTKNNGHDVVKTPEEMFNNDVIPNDLKFVCDTIHAYEMGLEAPASPSIKEPTQTTIPTQQPETKPEVEVPPGGNMGLLGGDPANGQGQFTQPEHTPTVDARGMVWDDRIHASTKTMLANGNWKNKRGVDKDLLVQVEAELLGNTAQSEPVEEIVQPNTTPGQIEEVVEETPSVDPTPEVEQTVEQPAEQPGSADRETLIGNISGAFGGVDKAEAFLMSQGILQEGQTIDVVSDENIKLFNDNLGNIFPN